MVRAKVGNGDCGEVMYAR